MRIWIAGGGTGGHVYPALAVVDALRDKQIDIELRWIGSRGGIEEDLVTRRVELLDYPLTRYRVSVPNEYLARIFRQFVDETAALATIPRWYNTLTTNCTNSLIAYVNEVESGAIPWHNSFVLTGRADAYLTGLGYLDTASAQPITRDWLAANPIR